VKNKLNRDAGKFTASGRMKENHLTVAGVHASALSQTEQLLKGAVERNFHARSQVNLEKCGGNQRRNVKNVPVKLSALG